MVVGSVPHVAHCDGPAGLESLAGGIAWVRWHPDVADDARLQSYAGNDQELAAPRPMLQYLDHWDVAASGGDGASLGEQDIEQGFQQRGGGQLGEGRALRNNPLERNLCPLGYGETAQKLGCRVLPELRHREASG